MLHAFDSWLQRCQRRIIFFNKNSREYKKCAPCMRPACIQCGISLKLLFLLLCQSENYVLLTKWFGYLMTARTNQSHSKTRNNFLVLFVSGKRCAWQATRLWLVYTKRFSVRNSPHTHTYIPFRRIQSACHVHGWWLMTTGTMQQWNNYN